MNIKALILAIGFCPLWSMAQSKISKPQIAFDFYTDSILPKKSYENIYLKPKLVDDYSYWKIECLGKFNLNINDTAVAIVNPTEIRNKLTVAKGSVVKSVGCKQKDCRYVFATRELKLGDNRFFTAIVEEFERKWFTYIFEIDSDGRIQNWCSGEVNKR